MEDGKMIAKLQKVLDFFIHVITTIPPSQYGRRTPMIQIPALSSDLFLPLIRAATNIFRREPTVLHINLPVYVIGDLHGSLFDLMRFLHDLGLPPDQSYVFLGDYIDRGAFSTETVVLLLLLKVAFPDQIWLIRGNHEFNEPCVPHSELVTEMEGLYGTQNFIGPLFEMFTWLPLAADIGHYAFAVHGGISASLTCLSQVEEICRPICTFQPKLVEDLLWSDPTESCPDTRPSDRGLGILFGINLVRKFLAKTGFQVIFRGHQSIMSGVQMSLAYKVTTIFSASNYCQDGDTHAGIVQVVPGPSYEKRTFPPLPPLDRRDVLLVSSDAFKMKTAAPKSMSSYGPRPIGVMVRDMVSQRKQMPTQGSSRRVILKQTDLAPAPRRRAVELPSPRRRTQPA
jgi:protein phosphatase